MRIERQPGDGELARSLLERIVREPGACCFFGNGIIIDRRITLDDKELDLIRRMRDEPTR